MGKLWLPAFRQGRYATLQRWFGWLLDRGGIEQHPAIAAQAALVTANIGRAGEADRWAAGLDRWQHAAGPRAEDLAAEAWVGVLRATLCRRGITQMRADADEAACKLATAGIATAGVVLAQGIARVLAGDIDDGDRWLLETVRVAQETGGHQRQAEALAERSLLMMARPADVIDRA